MASVHRICSKCKKGFVSSDTIDIISICVVCRTSLLQRGAEFLTTVVDTANRASFKRAYKQTKLAFRKSIKYFFELDLDEEEVMEAVIGGVIASFVKGGMEELILQFEGLWRLWVRRIIVELKKEV